MQEAGAGCRKGPVSRYVGEWHPDGMVDLELASGALERGNKCGRTGSGAKAWWSFFCK